MTYLCDTLKEITCFVTKNSEVFLLMELPEILAYLSALIIGLILGLIGGGGSILTVPVLVYILQMNTITATAYSLFIVGTSAMVGAYKNMQEKLVNYFYAVAFGVPAIIGVTGTRRYIIPNLPDEIFGTTKENAIMIFFALVMGFAGISMLYKRSTCLTKNKEVKNNFFLIFIEGIVVGVITGLVGAGGGFLIIPALIFLGKLPMKEAVGTSLFIITLKSLVGFFLGDVTTMEIDWKFLLSFTSLSIIGILIGVKLSKRISADKLKRGFGIFLLIMTCYIIYTTFIC